MRIWWKLGFETCFVLMLPSALTLIRIPVRLLVALFGLCSVPRVSQNLDAISTALARGPFSKPRASLVLVRCCYNYNDLIVCFMRVCLVTAEQ